MVRVKETPVTMAPPVSKRRRGCLFQPQGNMPEVTRRQFLLGSAAIVAGAGLGLLATAQTAQASNHDELMRLLHQAMDRTQKRMEQDLLQSLYGEGSGPAEGGLHELVYAVPEDMPTQYTGHEWRELSSNAGTGAGVA